MTKYTASLVFMMTPLTVLCASCADTDQGEGDVVVRVYGEDFIEQGIPAEAMSDGWAVTFDRFTVTADDIIVGGERRPAADAIDISGATNGAGHLLTEASVPAGSYTDPSFEITRVEVVGSAVRGDVTKTFDWTFTQATHYTGCETTTDVPAGGEATFQLTVHADHLFYDSLVAQDPALAFQALADADADGDEAITRAELEAADIGSYDPGSAADIDNLWGWLVAQTGTLGHVDGEGHCDAHAHSE